MPASAALMVVYNYVEAGHLWYKFLDVLGIQRLFSKQLLLSKLTFECCFCPQIQRNWCSRETLGKKCHHMYIFDNFVR